MSWLLGIIVGIILLASAGGTDPSAAPSPSSPAMTVPAGPLSNPGFAPHCDYGPNDDDVRGVVKAATPQLPDC